MALKTVFELKNSVAALLSGIDLSNVDNLNGALERAARITIQKADIPEASNIQNITLYSGVFDYSCDPRIFGQTITDIRPQGISRQPNNFVDKTAQDDFDRIKNWNTSSNTLATFQYFNGQPIIRIKAPFPNQQLIIDPMNSIGTSPNAWAATGTATNLAQDTTVFYQSPASLRFNLGAGSGSLTRTLQNSLDLSSYQGVGVAFMAIEIPSGATASDLVSVDLQLGSDSGNFDEVDETAGFLGAWVAGQWLLVAYDFSTAVTTGTPDWSAIQYVNINLVSSSSMNNFRVGGLWMSFPSQAQICYQSAAIFLAQGSTAPTTTITADTDSIILNDPAYTIYEIESASAVCQQTGGTTGSAMVQTFDAMLNGARGKNGVVLNEGLYDLYRGDNPSQELRQVGSYYDNSNGYDSWY